MVHPYILCSHIPSFLRMHACASIHPSIHPSIHSVHTCNDVQCVITSQMPPPAQGGQNLTWGRIDAERCQPFAPAQADEAARVTKLLLCDEHSCYVTSTAVHSVKYPLAATYRDCCMSSPKTHRRINFQQHLEARCCSTTPLTSLQPGTTSCTIQLVTGMNARA
jgi:hypothetical protein